MTGGTYERLESGLVRVEEGGQVGLFTPDGRWQSRATLSHAEVDR